MMNYKKINNLTGWGVFLVAFICYIGTVAPTGSFWDCGEFIAVSNELQVPHPPGAPMFLLLARLFAMFAPGPENVAYMINLLSVTVSAFTALFICWSVTLLGKKVIAKDEENPDNFKTITLMFAGAVGGLTAAFCDSVWFNAVEAEVYSMASFFTAIVIWLMLKWEVRANEKGNERWLLLIAYVVGISTGVHLLPLLTIPGLALIYYFKKYDFSWLGLGITFAVSVVMLAVVQYGVMQITFDIAWKFEEFFTGTIDLASGKDTGLGMPFGTGTAIWLLMILGAFIFGIYYSQKKQMALLNISLLGVVTVYIGFSSYAMIFIRSHANPPIDENNPGNILSFLSYMKREQYGERPLLYGSMYNAQQQGQKNGKPIYQKYSDKDKYVLDGYKQDITYAKGGERFFPRMYSPSHYTVTNGYKDYVKNKGSDVNSTYDDKPTGGENFWFFLKYQVHHMYIRYFMWNFVGRASDEQEDTWESGFEFAKFNKMPDWMRNNPTRNHYYFLPLILGILGILWQYQNNKKDAFIVAILFFFAGFAIILYLNQTPNQPRERDYSYAGSFQTFCIWIGLGVIGLVDIFQKFLKEKTPIIAGAICVLAVPGLMLKVNWRDHSRAKNYVAPDSAFNLLNSCAQNAILFTNGDNDTFPLWYLQEVEGVRTDVRIVNLSLLNTDWYIDQLKNQKSNDAPPAPIKMKEAEYIGEKNAYRQFQANKIITLPVDKQLLLKNGVVKPEDINKVDSIMQWTVGVRGGNNNSYVLKQDLMIMDMVINNANNGWIRPIYFAITIPTSSYIGLQNYFQLEGMTYRLVPIKTQSSNNQGYMGRVEKDIMYKNLMSYKFRNLNNPDVFYDSNIIRMIGNFRNNFFRLATAYIEDAQAVKADTLPANDNLADEYKKKAKEIMDYSLTAITDDAVETDAYIYMMHSKIYNDLGDSAKTKNLTQKAYDRAKSALDYEKKIKKGPLGNDDQNIYAMNLILRHYQEIKDQPNVIKLAQELYDYTNEDYFLNLTKPPTPLPNFPDTSIKQK